MKHYIYDGSFPGLLTVIFEIFYRREEAVGIYKKGNYQENLFAEKIVVNTDLEKFDRVYQAISKKISSFSLRLIYYAYLSEEKGVEELIYKYLNLGFKWGRKIEQHLTEEPVLKLRKLAIKVSRERHRLLGLLRFRRIEGDVFYAPVEPDYNVLLLLAPHFAKRLADQNWIIHDWKRELAIFYNQEEWVLTPLQRDFSYAYTKEESFYQELWREFFKSVTINNRKNPRLQQQMMPKKYWKHLIEK